MEDRKKTTVSKKKPNSTTKVKKTSTVKEKKPRKRHTKKKQTRKQKVEKWLKRKGIVIKKKKGQTKKQEIISKELISIICLILLSMIVVVGTSYAFFTTKIIGNKTSSMIAGSLSISFTEGENITLDNAYPMSDEKGMGVKPYTFTIQNTGNIDALYRIKLEEDTSDLKNTVSKDKIKISYKKETDNYTTPQLLSDFENSLILVTDETLTTGSSISYEIKMWIDEQADNEIQGKTYKAKVVVESIQKMDGE